MVSGVKEKYGVGGKRKRVEGLEGKGQMECGKMKRKSGEMKLVGELKTKTRK